MENLVLFQLAVTGLILLISLVEALVLQCATTCQGATRGHSSGS